jgi:DNA-binding YbaB/EbfC family protein
MKNIADLQKMIKTAKDMQDKLQKELSEMKVEGSSGGGMVTAVLDGRKNILSLHLEAEIVDKDEIDMLQDLVVAAFNDASSKIDEILAEKLGGLGGHLKIPGLF